jgi:hypothetical protein
VEEKPLRRILIGAILVALDVLWCGLAASFGAPLADALPDALPDAIAAAPSPRTVSVQVTAEVRREPVKKAVKVLRNWAVIAIRPGPCPTCPDQEVFGWKVETADGSPLTVAQAAAELAKGGLGPEEVNRLSHIVDAPARRLAKLLPEHLGPGTCDMLNCDTHPMQLVPAGVETQEQLDARTKPWGSGEGGRFRLFRRGR